MTLALTSVCIALDAHVRGYHAVYEHNGKEYPSISISEPYTTYEKAHTAAVAHVADHLDTIVEWDVAGNTPPKES